MYKLSLLLALLLSGSVLAKTDFPAGEGLSDFTQFRLYPFVDKAYQYMHKGQYGEAVKQWQHALTISPNNLVVEKELFKSYLALGQDASATQLLADFDKRTITNQGQLLLLSDIYILGLQAKLSSIQDATSDLLNHPLWQPSTAASEAKLNQLLMASINLSQQDANYERAMRQLQRHLKLDKEPFNLHREYGYLLLKVGRNEALEALLVSQPFGQSKAAFALSGELIQVYINSGNTSGALKWLAMRDNSQVGQLTPQEREQWITLLLETGEKEQAKRMLNQLPSDYRTQTLLTQLSSETGDLPLTREAAFKALAHIKNAKQEQEILDISAIHIAKHHVGLNDLVNYQVKFKQNTNQWQTLALNLAQEMQHWPSIITLLEDKQSTASLTQTEQALLVSAYQHQGMPNKAINLMQALYKQDANDLDQYSYLLMQQGKVQLASHELIKHYPFTRWSATRQQQLKSRLLVALNATGTTDQTHKALTQLQKQAVSNADKTVIAQQWLAIGQCEQAWQITQQLTKPLPQADLINLAYCFQPQDADKAYQVFKQSEQQGYNTQVQLELAYYEAQQGQNELAYRRWLQLSKQPDLAVKHRLAMASTALALSHWSQAEQWLTQYQQQNGEQNAQYWQLNAQLARALKQDEQALHSLQQLYSLQPSADVLSQMAQLQAPQQAAASLDKALLLEPENSHLQAQRGYLAQKLEQDNASQYFEQALIGMPTHYPWYEELAYQYVDQNEVALARQRLAVAVEHKDEYITTPTIDGISVQQHKYNLMRFNEQLNREYSVRLDYWQGENGLPVDLGLGAPNLTEPFAHYWSAEIEAKPYALNLGDPKLSGYARIIGQQQTEQRFDSLSGATLAGIGLKYQPIKTQSWYLYLEPQYNFEQQKADLLLRTTASMLNQGKTSGDLHVEGNGWTEQELYFDASYSVERDEYNLLSKYKIGQHIKLKQSVSNAATIMPYTAVVASTSTYGEDLRVLAGVSINLWRDGSERYAYRQKHSFAIEFHHSVDTYLTDDNGITFKVNLAW
ncbi:NfrA family protein [Motilimonas sp. KMU-193]|uniref:NfrA family protein n=1 Tax=Motilimonas sp. KMU-193 TaxID=3388668 RepID=UPI00396B2D81